MKTRLLPPALQGTRCGSAAAGASHSSSLATCWLRDESDIGHLLRAENRPRCGPYVRRQSWNGGLQDRIALASLPPESLPSVGFRAGRRETRRNRPAGYAVFFLLWSTRSKHCADRQHMSPCKPGKRVPMHARHHANRISAREMDAAFYG